MTGTRVPDPLAGGIGSGSGGAAVATAEDGHGHGAEHAGHASRTQGPQEQGAALRVLILGAGLIGTALHEALVARGHQSTLAVRNGDRRGDGVVSLDVTAPSDAAALAEVMAGVDVLVNTVGIFRDTAQQSFDAVHVKGPLRLFEAARDAGVGRIVQLSALGADPASPLPYFASKGQAEQALSAFGVDHAIVRPSLVFAPRGASTRWFAQLAGLPLLPLPGGGRQQVQPVHLDDLVEALVRLVVADEVPRRLDVVGPRVLALREYLELFRNAIGAPGATVPVSGHLARAGARLLARLSPRLPVDPDALAMLEAGNTSDPAPLARWLGRTPRDPATFIGHAAADAMRAPALLGWTVPLMRWTLVFMWVATAVISLWLYPRELSMALLGQVGLHGVAAELALWSAALLDLALGVALLVPGWRTRAYLAQLALVVGYTVIITFWLPGQWLHPFGPVLKNIPLLAMILALLAIDRRPWT